MTVFSIASGAVRGEFWLRTTMVAATLCLAACQRSQPPEAAPATTESKIAIPEPAPEAVRTPAPPEAPLPPVDASDDEFVGWYIDQNGVGRLQACGEAAQLQLADPTFLRELKGKLGSGNKPVYVRLRVRLAPASRLAVTEVQQFGVDETPVQDCVLIPTGG